MVVATLAIAGSLAAWLLFGGTSSDGAEAFSMLLGAIGLVALIVGLVRRGRRAPAPA